MDTVVRSARNHDTGIRSVLEWRVITLQMKVTIRIFHKVLTNGSIEQTLVSVWAVATGSVDNGQLTCFKSVQDEAVRDTRDDRGSRLDWGHHAGKPS